MYFEENKDLQMQSLSQAQVDVMQNFDLQSKNLKQSCPMEPLSTKEGESWNDTLDEFARLQAF